MPRTSGSAIHGLRTGSRRLVSRLALASLLVLAGCGDSGTGPDDGNGSVLNPELIVVNELTDRAISFLYWSACDAGSWGPDRLGADVLSVGEERRWTLTEGCWDLLADLEDGTEVTRFGEQFDNGDVVRWTISD